MRRSVATLVGVLILALLAAGLSEATLAVGHRGGISNDLTERPQAAVAVTSPSPSSARLRTPSPSPSASPSPVPSPSATPTPTATTTSFVHMRASESTSSAILFDLNGGTQVQLLTGGNGQWQEVEYEGTTGYIYKSYLND